MHILIIDDDAALGLFLERGFRLEGHEVEVIKDGQSALIAAVKRHFDLIILDLSLPHKDGLQVLEEMASKSVDASILVLTARNSIEDKIRCFDLGADDFMAKPFSLSELTARCRALMRRRMRFTDSILRQGDLELHRMERRVIRSGRLVDLTGKEFALLEYLMLARGRTCSRTELLKQVWQMSPGAGTNVVDVYINYLRKKLCATQTTRAGEPDGATETDRLIETVRGEGYSLGALGAAVANERKPVGRVYLPQRHFDGHGPSLGHSSASRQEVLARA